MERKYYTDSLTGKMVKRLLNGLAVGIFLIIFLYLGSANLLRQYFLTSAYLYNAQASRISELQNYVNQHDMAATDSSKLRKWAAERNIHKFTVSRGKQLLFDVSYDGELLPGSKEISRHTWKSYYTVTFTDGDANIYIDEGFAEKYYYILLGISFIAGFAACLGIFISGMQEDVAYIQCLGTEVAAISQGNLQGIVTIKGNDELAQLAHDLDQMRRKLNEKEQIENALRTAQEKLVLGMSHDLRTPLTGLLAYMEILKKQEREGKVSREYIVKAYDKILQIKNLSDQMFEYFLIDSHKEIQLEPPEEISSAFGDYLSEMCALFEYDGFLVNAKMPEWKPVFVQVNTDYIGRIMNNIISNLGKYGDRQHEVKIALIYGQDTIGILIQNRIASPEQYIEGTGIGVRNISLMMEQMGGRAEVDITEQTYQIKLIFPICAEN